MPTDKGYFASCLAALKKVILKEEFVQALPLKHQWLSDMVCYFVVIVVVVVVVVIARTSVEGENITVYVMGT